MQKKRVVWGGLVALKVVGNAPVPSRLIETMCLFYRFRDIAGYLSNVVDFAPPNLQLAHP